jgi:hypothetical protein
VIFAGFSDLSRSCGQENFRDRFPHGSNLSDGEDRGGEINENYPASEVSRKQRVKRTYRSLLAIARTEAEATHQSPSGETK